MHCYLQEDVNTVAPSLIGKADLGTDTMIALSCFVMLCPFLRVKSMVPSHCCARRMYVGVEPPEGGC